MNKEELIGLIKRKEEALVFWGYLKNVPYQQEKLDSLNRDISMLKIKLRKQGGRILDFRLNWMRLKNFKGIKDFTLQAQGKNLTVYGDNGTGKTTQMDAFLWLLFGKDSSDRSNFKVKPQDANGKDIHNLQTEVEVELLVDGSPLKLRKMLEEKWTRKKGSEIAKLTGNTISYWWNEVPVKESEYKKKISELIDESIFRMLTNPMYFNTTLKWENRRKIILEMCGDMTDEQVTEADKKLKRLGELLDGRSVEEYKKVVADRLKRLKKERDDIPPRIDELTMKLPNKEPDYTDVESELEGYRLILSSLEKKLVDAVEIANTYRRKQQEISRLKNKLEDIKVRIDREAGADRRKLTNEKAELENEGCTLEQKIELHKSAIEHCKQKIETNKAKREKLLAEWREINKTKAAQISLQFDKLDKTKASQLGVEFIESDEILFCPTCGQELPEEDKENKLMDMRQNFEKRKQQAISWTEQKLEENKREGLKVKEDTEMMEKVIENRKIDMQKAEQRLSEINKRYAEIEEILSKPIEQPDYTQDAEYKEISKAIKRLEIELNKPAEDQTTQIIEKKNNIQEKINACNAILHNRTMVQETKKRIEELKEKEKELSEQITDLEGQGFLIEQFTVTKVNLLEDRINSHFKHVKFKMFEQQINGGIAETCEAMVNTNGSYVPFAEANHAGKVNAGLDVINALSNFYGVTVPLFVDFRESVTKLIDTNNQVINLYKSAKDKKLRVELED
jgi:DNA repair exonuclease SbcCD ATPase subunit